MTIEALINKVACLTREEKVSLGRSCVANITKKMKASGADGKSVSATIIGFISLFVSADKCCSVEEYELIKSIYQTDLSYDKFYEITNNGSNADFITLMDSLADSLDGELKMDICLFGLCILVSDNKLTQAEYDLFVRILE